MNRKTALILVLAALVLCFAQVAQASNKKLMTIKMAKQDLKRNMVESIVGYKVKSQSEFGLTEDAEYKVDTKAEAVIKGVQVDECIYDQEKDVAICYGHVDLGTVQNILGGYSAYKGVTIRHIGLGSMTESSRPALRALRAAMLNAYDELATLLVGEQIYSRSTAENFILTNDQNRSRMCAAVYGAHIPQHSVKFGKKGWGWEADGTAFVVLQLDVEKVKDLMGNYLVYKGENIVEVMGMGAMTDDLSTSRAEEQGLTPGSGPKVSYGPLDVPVPGQAPADGDYKGGAKAQ